MLEILAVRLKALSLLGTLRLRRKAAAAAAEAAAVAAAVVLPGVRNSAGGGRLRPCSETSASVTTTGAHSESPAKPLSLHSPDPHALTHCRPAQNIPVVCYSHAPCLPPLAFLAPSALASLCSSSMSCLLPNAMPLSYCPLHSPFPPEPHRAPASTPYLWQESIPSPFSVLAPTNGLSFPGVHRPDLRLHVCKSDTSQLPFR